MTLHREVQLRMEWEGHGLVHKGMFLKTPNGRTAYEVVRFRRIKRRDPNACKAYMLTCVRHRVSDLETTLHCEIFTWNKR